MPSSQTCTCNKKMELVCWKLFSPSHLLVHPEPALDKKRQKEAKRPLKHNCTLWKFRVCLYMFLGQGSVARKWAKGPLKHNCTHLGFFISLYMVSKTGPITVIGHVAPRLPPTNQWQGSKNQNPLKHNCTQTTVYIYPLGGWAFFLFAIEAQLYPVTLRCNLSP